MNSPIPFLPSLTLAVVASIVCVSANAGLIGTTTPDGLGGYTYTYQVDNQNGAFAVSSWSLEFTFTPDWDPNDMGFGGDVSVPTGWAAGAGIPISGIAAQDFYSLSPNTDVLPGTLLGDFSFTSLFPPDQVKFMLFGAGGESLAGLVGGPATPDEGPGWGLSLLTVLALLRLGRRASP